MLTNFQIHFIKPEILKHNFKNKLAWTITNRTINVRVLNISIYGPRIDHKKWFSTLIRSSFNNLFHHTVLLFQYCLTGKSRKPIYLPESPTPFYSRLIKHFISPIFPHFFLCSRLFRPCGREKSGILRSKSV